MSASASRSVLRIDRCSSNATMASLIHASADHDSIEFLTEADRLSLCQNLLVLPLRTTSLPIRWSGYQPQFNRPTQSCSSQADYDTQ